VSVINLKRKKLASLNVHGKIKLPIIKQHNLTSKDQNDLLIKRALNRNIKNK